MADASRPHPKVKAADKHSKKQSSSEDEEDEEEESSEEMSSSEEALNWIQWFCSLKGNEFFVEVDEEYIQDDFNLTGLSSNVPNYELALDVILDTEAEEPLSEEQQETIEAAAEVLYGLIHARYILTARGLAQMSEKCSNGSSTGRCPRVYCQGQALIPVGLSDLPRLHTVKLYCPRCRDIYFPKYARHQHIDGAFFGTTFPHLLVQSYPDMVPAAPTQIYVPRIYGFKIHQPHAPPAPHDLKALQLQQQQQQQQQKESQATSSQAQTFPGGTAGAVLSGAANGGKATPSPRSLQPKK